MLNSYTFAVDVMRTISAHLAAKTTELGFLIASNASFTEWLSWEAFLACKQRETSYPFCEVAAQPTYASEGVPDTTSTGHLRVGGPDDGAHHCWAFIVFAVLADTHTLAEATERLKQLGWKKSAALLVVLTANSQEWPHPPLTPPLVLTLPNGGTTTLTAYDCKRNPTDILTGCGRA